MLKRLQAVLRALIAKPRTPINEKRSVIEKISFMLIIGVSLVRIKGEKVDNGIAGIEQPCLGNQANTTSDIGIPTFNFIKVGKIKPHIPLVFFQVIRSRLSVAYFLGCISLLQLMQKVSVVAQIALFFRFFCFHIHFYGP